MKKYKYKINYYRIFKKDNSILFLSNTLLKIEKIYYY